MADSEQTEWGKALARELQANKAAGKSPATWWALARKLTNLSGGSPTMSSWQTNIKRYRKTDFLPTEDKALLLAEALGVERATLPDSSTPATVSLLGRRLESLEDEAATIEEVTGLLQPLRGALERQKEAILLLANGDTAGALRVLSEVTVP